MAELQSLNCTPVVLLQLRMSAVERLVTQCEERHAPFSCQKGGELSASGNGGKGKADLSRVR